VDLAAGTTRGALLFAMREEMAGLSRILSESGVVSRSAGAASVFRLGHVEVWTMVGGVGRGPAARATADLISRGAGWLICAGFAGGLAPWVRVGDVVVAEGTAAWTEPYEARCAEARAAETGGGPRDVDPMDYSVRCHPDLVALAPPVRQGGASVFRGLLLTTTEVIGTGDAKQRIRRLSGATAVDMESWAVAEVCGSRGVPFVAVRAVTDTAADDVPEAAASLASVGSLSRRLLRLAGRPGDWSTALRIRTNARTASDSLGDVLAMMLARLSVSSCR